MKVPGVDEKGIADRLVLGAGMAYVLFLVWAVLWKCGVPFVGDGTERAINLVPFRGNTGWELQFNMVIFVPFGFCLAAHRSRLKLVGLAVATLLTSLALEVIQFVLAVGRSDITDLLMNTVGGLIGIVAFLGMSKLFGKHERKATLAICALLVLLELYMTVSFAVLGQLNLGFMVIRLA